MSIIGKYLAKNLFAKPFRTFLLVFCIACCSFVAMVSFDVTGNIEKIIKSTMMQLTGTADMTVADDVGVTEAFALPCENRQLLVFSSQGALIDRTGEFYSFFHKTSYEINTMDYETAQKMRLLGKKLELASGEAAVSKKLAGEAKWAVGDTVTLYDGENHACEYRIAEIVPSYGMANGRNIVFLDQEDYRKLGVGLRANLVYVDVLDDEKAAEVGKIIEDTDYNAKVSIFIEKDEFREMIQTLTVMFSMIFAVCFLLVIFVAVSVSNRIVSERFSVVGTFRSLGISSAYCTRLLLVENALYGIIGSLVGILLYALVRPALFSSMLMLQVTPGSGIEVETDIQNIRPIAVAAVIALGILVMLVCPLKEVLRTSKTAIRDIIFDNKDTAYRMHRATKIVGLICAAGAAVTFFIKGSSVAQIACFILLIVAVALLFPWLLKLIAGVLSRLFERLNMPIARMAALECYARKSTVGSSILCVTASTLAIIIFIFVSTLGSSYDLKTYDCDVIVTVNPKEQLSRFSYIDRLSGVTDTEILYLTDTQMKINGKKCQTTVLGLNEGGFDLLTAIKDCPKILEKDCFAMDRSMAKRMGVKEGDMVDVIFDEDSYLPITKTLKLSALVNSYNYDTTGNMVILPKDLYIDMYQNYPGKILVRCENQGEVVSQIKTYSGTTATVETNEEYLQYWAEKESGMRGMLTAVIAIGIGLTFVGMISNQLIGFQGRKRECAVLASTSMTRGKLARMFLLESMIAAGIALLIALPLGVIAFIPLQSVLEIMSEGVTIAYDVRSYLLFLAALWAVFTLVALFPVRELRKMNLAAQLKYE